MVFEMENKCAVKASVPMIYWSQGKDFLRWAVLTECGKTRYIDRIRGSKHPLGVNCCGSHPLDPTKTSMVLKTDRMTVQVSEPNHPEKSITLTEITQVEKIMEKIETTNTVANNVQSKKVVAKAKTAKTATNNTWPEKEELSSLVNSQSMRSLSAKLGFSANSIKKRCKELGITIPTMKFNWSSKT